MLSGIPLFLLVLAAVVLMIIACAVWRIPAFLALLAISLVFGVLAGMPAPEVLMAITQGFGNLLGSIGIVVVLGSMIGVFLESSGAALRLADAILHLAGRRRPMAALSMIGAITGIPVFCDSGFIILSSLPRALALEAKRPAVPLYLSLAAGLYTTHTLVPPTPGPIAAAANLGAADSLGLVILVGLIASVPVVAGAYWFNVRLNLPGLEACPTPEGVTLPKPALIPSLLPLTLPILLIAAASLVKLVGVDWPWLAFLGHPIMALGVGLLCCVPLVWKAGVMDFGKKAEDAIRLSGPILIITGAGGAFGQVLRATPLADLFKYWVTEGQFTGLGFLVIAFLVAALLKTAQGSSTSALVISSALLAPLLPVAGIDQPLEMALVVLALGGGAMTVSHANDSYFWVVTQFSGLDTRSAFRWFTAMTAVQGLLALLTALALGAFIL